MDLAKHGDSDSFDDRFWYYFERNAALLYMSILAEHLAMADQQRTVVSTDQRVYFDLNRNFDTLSDMTSVYSVDLQRLLPCPASNISFKRIVHFRTKYRDELLALRAEIDALEAQIAKAGSHRAVENTVSQFQERIERELSVLRRAMSAAR
jgi:hypothetical protein